MILITGIPRSRTSMIAAMFEACGANFGPQHRLIGPHKNNPLGFYERMDIRKDLQEPYFKKIGFNPMDRKNYPVKEDIIIDKEWKNKVNKMLEPEVNALKEPKFCLYWEVWHYAFPQAKWIVVMRPREEIIESAMKRTPWMANSKLSREVWEEWIDRHLLRISHLVRNPDTNVQMVHSNQVVEGNLAELQNTVFWTGLNWNGNDVRKLIMKDKTYVSEIRN